MQAARRSANPPTGRRQVSASHAAVLDAARRPQRHRLGKPAVSAATGMTTGQADPSRVELHDGSTVRPPATARALVIEEWRHDLAQTTPADRARDMEPGHSARLMGDTLSR